MMNRQARINLILLLLAVALGLLVWHSRPARLPPLTPLDPERVERIRISDLKGGERLLSRRDGHWHIGSSRADQERVSQLLRICATPSLERFALPRELAPFGLDAPHIRMRIDDLSLDFGATDPINGWRYVRVGSHIHLIADGFYHHLTLPAEAWQARP